MWLFGCIAHSSCYCSLAPDRWSVMVPRVKRTSACRRPVAATGKGLIATEALAIASLPVLCGHGRLGRGMLLAKRALHAFGEMPHQDYSCESRLEALWRRTGHARCFRDDFNRDRCECPGRLFESYAKRGVTIVSCAREPKLGLTSVPQVYRWRCVVD